MASLKLLVVEDHIPSLELMAEVFTSLEAEVWPLSDSREAASLIDKEKFDGIFLDLEMPDMSGFELARKIRKSSWNKTTPIVIVTGAISPSPHPRRLNGQLHPLASADVVA